MMSICVAKIHPKMDYSWQEFSTPKQGENKANFAKNNLYFCWTFTAFRPPSLPDPYWKMKEKNCIFSENTVQYLYSSGIQWIARTIANYTMLSSNSSTKETMRGAWNT
jgi:hypothetical protein